VKLRGNADFAGYQTLNKKEQVLGADPSLTGSDGGRTWWRSDTGQFRGWDGAAAQTLTNLIESIVGDGTITAALAGKQVTVGVPAASGVARGTMSATDKSKLDAATNGNTPSALVQRDASGNFSAGTITATLTGTADNATTLGGQSLAQVRDFAQTTGQRTLASAISDYIAAVTAFRLDQFTAPTSPVGIGNQVLRNVADPVQAQDGATKNYVDSVATGLDPKGSVRFATTTALTANYANGTAGLGATLTATTNVAFPTTDGVTPAVGNRVLVKNQAAGLQNGIYTLTTLGTGSTPWVLTRATDADQAAEVTPGMFTFVEEGTTLAKTGWVLGSTGATTMGTTALPFTQFSGAGTYLAGSGLSLTGQTFAAVGTANRISVGSAIDIAATYVGQSSITTVGTIGTGIWQGTPVGVAYGGTGAATPAAARAALGATTKYSADLPAGTTIGVNHGLGTTDIIVLVIEKSSGDVVITDVNVTDANNITIGFGSAVAASAYRVVVVG
jgi:hypothetical protein